MVLKVDPLERSVSDVRVIGDDLAERGIGMSVGDEVRAQQWGTCEF